jgi:hypothetical protein
LESKYKLPRRYREKFQRRVTRHLQRYNKDIKVVYTLKLTNGDYDNNEVKRVILNRIKEEKGERLARWIGSRIRVVRAPDVRLGDVIRRAAQVHKMDRVEPVCKCNEWPEELKIDGHVLCKAEEIRDVATRELLTINNKTPLVLTTRRYVWKQEEGCNKFLKEVGIGGLREEDRKVIERGYRERRSVLTEGRVKSVLREWKKEEMVIYERDKNGYTWAVQCTTKYVQRLEETYNPETNKQYKGVNRKEEEVMKEVELEYEKLTAGKQVRKKKEWSLSTGRVLPKDKDIQKSRPIVPFFKHIGRNLGKVIGAAMTVVIKEVDKLWVTMNLSTTQEFTKQIREFNNNSFWKKRIGGKFTMAKMDIKNQFTNMDKEEGYKSVCIALDELERRGMTSIRISKDRTMKKRDGFKVGGNKYWTVTNTDIKEYVRFELDNCYIRVLNKIYQQVEGLPMGGMISACVAQLDAMRKENENLRVWKKAKFPGIWHRYRDDTFLLTTGHKSREWMLALASRLEEMYGAGLTVEVEDIQKEEINMLDTKVVITDKGIVTRDNNKNIDFKKESWEDSSKWKVRYPSVGGNIDPKVFINTIIGAQTATKRRMSNLRCYEEDTIKNVAEWHRRGYKTRWIRTAIYRVDQGIINLVNPFLAMLRHGRRGEESSRERIEPRSIK